ncbi:MAG: methylated-DNA--[protein]-cysteine S-methyltransferase [Bacteroidia bacterium]|nr:methylated-DNA--[protein]-cysteine S-methyltransferase [Bacteroidia bacterium]
MAGTGFQKKVWNELLKIPYGTTRSYKQQSLILKKPEAIRAVAQANGLNKIAILIPCHQVIGEDRKLTGYGGLWRKKWLLDLEAKHSEKYNQRSFSF